MKQSCVKNFEQKKKRKKWNEQALWCLKSIPYWILFCYAVRTKKSNAIYSLQLQLFESNKIKLHRNRKKERNGPNAIMIVSFQYNDAKPSHCCHLRLHCHRCCRCRYFQLSTITVWPLFLSFHLVFIYVCVSHKCVTYFFSLDEI